MMPLFGPFPVKLKPMTANAPVMSFSLASTASTWRMASEVYSTEAPGGACTMMMNQPWSSSGTKPVGTRLYTTYVAASPRKNTTSTR